MFCDVKWYHCLGITVPHTTKCWFWSGWIWSIAFQQSKYLRNLMCALYWWTIFRHTSVNKIEQKSSLHSLHLCKQDKPNNPNIHTQTNLTPPSPKLFWTQTTSQSPLLLILEDFSPLPRLCRFGCDRPWGFCPVPTLECRHLRIFDALPTSSNTPQSETITLWLASTSVFQSFLPRKRKTQYFWLYNS